jgi:hypothetical protein
VKPVIVAQGESVDTRDLHPEARWCEPVVRLPDDYAVKAAVERALDPAERRRFRALYLEARRNGHGVRSAVRCGLRRLMAEATVRMEVAMKETGR